MKRLVALMICAVSLGAAAQSTITYPYNPDGNADGDIAVGDLQDFLGTYGNPFSPSEIMVGDSSLTSWVDQLSQTILDLQNQIAELSSNTGAMRWGCTDGLATNFDPNAVIDVGSCDYLAIGDFHEGGIIFYLDGNGGGLIAAAQDESTPISPYGWTWGCIYDDVPGADGTAIGTGYQNTMDIVNAGCENGAANYCADLVLNGYDDWYLPSSGELTQMYLNIGGANSYGLGNIGFFQTYSMWTSDFSQYWSSTESSEDQDFAFYVDVIQNLTGGASHGQKSASKNARAIRSFVLTGCSDDTACNYNPAAIEDGPCSYTGDSCDDGNSGTADDSWGSACVCEGVEAVYGCLDDTACNYSTIANTDDGSCNFDCYGCLDSTACNYDSEATEENGSCEFTSCAGCTDDAACNYDANVTIDDGSCSFGGDGCDDGNSETVNDSWNGACICEGVEVPGCADETACNYDETASVDDGSCQYAEEFYDCNGDCLNDADGDSVCDELEVPGCTDETACNYDETATDDDGSCYFGGDSCDDNNYSTTNDTWSNACVCEGTSLTGCSSSDFVEYSGHSYAVITIGNQCWFAENCRYLPEVSPSSEGGDSGPYYYVYGYEGSDLGEAKSTSNYETYGVLYNWPAVMTDSICPSGWHVPSDDEFTQLTDYLGGENGAGGKMKEAGFDHWNSPNTGATNSSGWTGLPGGSRFDGGGGFFWTAGDEGLWWSSSADPWETSTAHARILLNNSEDITDPTDTYEKNKGYSVRCVRDGE